jgi:TolA-binding protein
MSLAATDKTPDACVALAELKDKYPNASVSVRSRGAEEQAKLKCKAN